MHGRDYFSATVCSAFGVPEFHATGVLRPPPGPHQPTIEPIARVPEDSSAPRFPPLLLDARPRPAFQAASRAVLVRIDTSPRTVPIGWLAHRPVSRQPARLFVVHSKSQRCMEPVQPKRRAVPTGLTNDRPAGSVRWLP